MENGIALHELTVQLGQVLRDHKDFRRQLDKMLDDHGTIMRRLDDAEDDRGDIKGLLHDAVVEVGGIPGQLGRDPQRASLRARLHKLEADKSAATAAAAAVAAASKVYDASSDKRFSRREKIMGLAVTGLLTLLSFASLVVTVVTSR